MKAFTLVELLVVVAIIGILAAVGIVSFNGYVRSTELTSGEINIQKIAIAQNQFRNFNGNFSQDDTCTATSPNTDSTTSINTNLLLGNNIDADNAFNYCSTGTGTTLVIFALHLTDTDCLLTYNTTGLITRANC